MGLGNVLTPVVVDGKYLPQNPVAGTMDLK
jgi:hypothetical protein